MVQRVALRLPRTVWQFCTCTRRNLYLLIIVIILLAFLLYVLKKHGNISSSSYLMDKKHGNLSTSSNLMDKFALLDPKITDILNRTFRAFVQAMDSNNITFFIYAGSLIGSARHHGRVPWDDYFDVLINITDRDRSFKALSNADPHYFAVFKYANVFKFYPTYGRRLHHTTLRPPFIDVTFFQENDTHIWNPHRDFPSERWPKSLVFPLRRRPLDDHMLLAPCNVDAFLKKTYNVSTCQTNKFRHLSYSFMPFPPVSVPCEMLHKLYPFVEKSPVQVDPSGNRYILESLVYNGTVLKTFTAMESC